MEQLVNSIDYTSIDDYKELCFFAFDVVIISLMKLDERKLKFPDKFKTKSSPLFVTWSKGEDRALRGCIGTFASDNLEKNLLLYSYHAAFKDSRFRPISLKELPLLHCGVSLLVNFEEASDAFDWEVGKHGITMNLIFGLKRHHATFLPEIAKDQQWDKKTTLKHLLQKSGFYGKLTDVFGKIKITRYQSIKVGITHREYTNYKLNKKDYDFILN